MNEETIKKILFYLIGKNQKEQNKILAKIKKEEIDEYINKNGFGYKK